MVGRNVKAKLAGGRLGFSWSPVIRAADVDSLSHFYLEVAVGVSGLSTRAVNNPEDGQCGSESPLPPL